MISLNNDQLVIAGILSGCIFSIVFNVRIVGTSIAHTWHLSRRIKKRTSRQERLWQNELRSLGIEPGRQNELNDEEELRALAESIKAVYYQDYKMVNNNNC